MGMFNGMLYGSSYSGYYTAIRVDDAEGAKMFDYGQAPYLEEQWNYVQESIANYPDDEEYNQSLLDWYQELLFNSCGTNGVRIEDVQINEFLGMAQVSVIVKNHSAERHVFSLGQYSDVLIGDNDRAPIHRMHDEDGNVTGIELLNTLEEDECASLIVTWRGDGCTQADDYWFGGYYINNSTDGIAGAYREMTYDWEGNPEDNYYVEDGEYDSGMGWCWRDEEIAPGETKTYSVLICIGQKPVSKWPDLVIPQLTLSDTDVDASGSVGASVTIDNTGLAPAPARMDITYYLEDVYGNYAKTLATFFTQEEVPAGGRIIVTNEVPVLAPIGEYKMRAVVNDTYNIDEKFHENNTSPAVPLNVRAPYITTVNASKATYCQGDTVLITGRIEGTEVSSREVELYLIYDGVRESHVLLTNADGMFNYRFVPSAEQCGHFDAGACFPGTEGNEVQTSFNIYGLSREDRSYVAIELQTAIEYQGNFAVYNPGELDLTDIKVQVISKPETCEIEFEDVDIMHSKEVRGIPFRLTSYAANRDVQWSPVEFEITSREGARLRTSIYYYCRTPYPKLEASIPYIETTMAKGHTRNYAFTICNTGVAETGRISLMLPEWMKAATPTEMPSLQTGDSAQIVLQFTPTDQMVLNMPMSGEFYINPENGNYLTMGYSITPVSDAEGTLRLEVCDEYTYYAEDKPHVVGAAIELYHPSTGELIASGTSDEDGYCDLKVHEGVYRLMVTAEGHEQYHKDVIVDPGVVTDKTVNLQINTIEITWNVVETEVEDVYNIVTTVTYETNVPAPVVVMSCVDILDLDALEVDECISFPITLTNHGLISANNTMIDLGTLPKFKMEILNYDGQPFDLMPKTAVTYMARITRLEAGTPMNDDYENGDEGNASGSIRMVKTEGGGICAIAPNCKFEWKCGNDVHSGGSGKTIQTSSTGCGGGSTGGWFFGGGGGTGGDGGVPGVPTGGQPSLSLSDECNTCALEMAKRWVECGVSFIPGVGCIYGLSQCWNSAFNIQTTWQDLGINCGSAGVGCLLDIADATVPGVMLNILMCIYNLKQPCTKKDVSDKKMAMLMEMQPEELMSAIRHSMQEMSSDDDEPSYMQEFREAADICGRYMQAWIDILADYVTENYAMYASLNDIIKVLDYMASVTPATFNAYDIPMPYLAHDMVPHVHSYITEPNGDTYLYCNFNEVKSHMEDRLREYLQNTMTIIGGGTVEGDFYLNTDSLLTLANIIIECEEAAHAMGYPDLNEMWQVKKRKLQEKLSESTDGVCASVTLKIEQQMVMTRQAFRGTLGIHNGFDVADMEDIVIDLTVKNTENGQLATDEHFQINVESLEGMDGDMELGASWRVAASSNGTATFLFIPTKYAAPERPVVYAFGGTISYNDPNSGSRVTRNLFPVKLTVNPSPEIDLTYFLQRDVIGDDPRTEDIVEPVKPGEFAVLLRNIGKGEAKNISMVTHQPEIIENEKNLKVDFEIVSAQLNGQEETLALGGDVATDFGSIPAGGSSYAQWWIECPLLGHYSNYNIEATHVTSYGNKNLSLLNSVSIHEMIRSLRIPGDETPGTIGWMCNDIVDGDDLPDVIYFSTGDTMKVTRCIETTINAIADSENSQYILSLQPTADGWNYGWIEDPTEGNQQLLSAVRIEDGTVIPLSNIWQTDRTLRDSRSPVYENILHIADVFASNEKQEYLITFAPAPDVYLDVNYLTNLNEDVYYTPVKTIDFAFNKAIESSTFDVSDITFELQGKPLDLSALTITALTTEENAYRLDLDTLTMKSGFYVLTIQCAGITDFEGYNGRSGRQISWTQYIDPSSIEPTSFIDDSENQIIYDAMGNTVSRIDAPGLYIFVDKRRGNSEAKKVLVR